MAELRRKILDLREKINAAAEDVARARAELLQKLLATDDPLKMARSYLSELDEVFGMVLQSEMRAAHTRGDRAALEALQRVATVIAQVTEENMPVEIVLTRRLLAASSEEQMNKILESNQKLLQPAYVEFLEGLEATSRQQGETRTAERLAQIRALVMKYITPAESQPAETPPPPSTPAQIPPLVEKRTASGLIIAKR